jgi:putative cardiolipin synthase
VKKRPAVIFLVLLGGVLFAIGVVAAFGLARLPPRDPGPYSAAVPVADDAPLDHMLAATLAEHPDESGFRLVADGVEAFALRALSARSAQRSLDVQYYIWHADVTGVLLIHELLNAADRGVRVRVLLDDLDAHAKNFELVAIDAHPNIEVRIFNPFATREGVAGKLIEGVSRFSRLERRMHNKAWIADNRVAIAGGRNIGDEYFTASEHVNFIDLDFELIGPAVNEMSAAFDRYWNSAAVWSMAALNPAKVDRARLDALRESATQRYRSASQSNYVRALRDSRLFEQAAPAPDVVLHWSRDVQVLSDDPLKAQLAGDALARSTVANALSIALNASQRTVTLVSAYFVPGERGTQTLTRLARSGRSLTILTNSLAATDVVAVHGGYAPYRSSLIDAGVAVWELKPDSSPGQRKPSAFGSSVASLHTKAAIIDQQLFVGSFNLDPRSVSLNCEQGVLVRDAALAAQAAALFARVAAPEHAWRVSRDGAGQLQWTDGHKTLNSEPGASLARRAFARVTQWLPLESQL